jgi:hypothetical protein
MSRGLAIGLAFAGVPVGLYVIFLGHCTSSKWNRDSALVLESVRLVDLSGIRPEDHNGGTDPIQWATKVPIGVAGFSRLNDDYFIFPLAKRNERPAVLRFTVEEFQKLRPPSAEFQACLIPEQSYETSSDWNGRVSVEVAKHNLRIGRILIRVTPSMSGPIVFSGSWNPLY